MDGEMTGWRKKRERNVQSDERSPEAGGGREGGAQRGAELCYFYMNFQFLDHILQFCVIFKSENKNSDNEREEKTKSESNISIQTKRLFVFLKKLEDKKHNGGVCGEAGSSVLRSG